MLFNPLLVTQSHLEGGWAKQTLNQVSGNSFTDTTHKNTREKSQGVRSAKQAGRVKNVVEVTGKFLLFLARTKEVKPGHHLLFQRAPWSLLTGFWNFHCSQVQLINPTSLPTSLSSDKTSAAPVCTHPATRGCAALFWCSQSSDSSASACESQTPHVRPQLTLSQVSALPEKNSIHFTSQRALTDPAASPTYTIASSKRWTYCCGDASTLPVKNKCHY